MSAIVWILVCLGIIAVFALAIAVIKGDNETNAELEALDRRMREGE